MAGGEGWPAWVGHRNPHCCTHAVAHVAVGEGAVEEVGAQALHAQGAQGHRVGPEGRVGQRGWVQVRRLSGLDAEQLDQGLGDALAASWGRRHALHHQIRIRGLQRGRHWRVLLLGCRALSMLLLLEVHGSAPQGPAQRWPGEPMRAASPVREALCLG